VGWEVIYQAQRVCKAFGSYIEKTFLSYFDITICIGCPKEKFWKVFSTLHACIIGILARTIHQLVCEVC
jgi:hypothetical protein